MKKEEFVFNGHNATVLIPDNFNGKWIWKTEFFYAFDQAERALFDKGYARVYYQISDMYGNDEAVRLMHAFHLHMINELGFTEKPLLFGFSRGGLYAFDYTLYYPEYVAKIYLDAPVLNLKSWPPKGSKEYYEMLNCYLLDETTYENGGYSPVDKLEEFASKGIPVMIVAGAKDATVPYDENCQIMVDYYKNHGLDITYVLKPDCDHHPHSLEDVTPIAEFIEKPDERK